MRDCGWKCIPAVGWSDSSQTVCPGSAGRHTTVLLSTRVVTESVPHVVQALASLDFSATILSIDGVYDVPRSPGHGEQGEVGSTCKALLRQPIDVPS